MVPELREQSNVFTGRATPTSMRLSPDGRTLAWLDGLGDTLWDVSGDRPRRRAWLHGKELVHDVSFGPGGKTMVLRREHPGRTRCLGP